MPYNATSSQIQPQKPEFIVVKKRFQLGRYRTAEFNQTGQKTYTGEPYYILKHIRGWSMILSFQDLLDLKDAILEMIPPIDNLAELEESLNNEINNMSESSLKESDGKVLDGSK